LPATSLSEQAARRLHEEHGDVDPEDDAEDTPLAFREVGRDLATVLHGRSLPESGAGRHRRQGHVAAGSKLMILDSGCSGIPGRRNGLSDALSELVALAAHLPTSFSRGRHT